MTAVAASPPTVFGAPDDLAGRVLLPASHGLRRDGLLRVDEAST